MIELLKQLKNKEKWSFISHSQQETETYAALIATSVKPPFVFLLKGDLGAGKTTFSRGFVNAFDKENKIRVKSPTYALAHSYHTIPIVHHMDLYRLSNSTEAYELGLTEQINDEQSLSLIEWPKDILDEISAHISVLEISFQDLGEDSRKLSFSFVQSSTL